MFTIDLLISLLTVLLFLTSFVMLVAITTYIPMPLFSHSQGTDEVIGKVTKIKKLRGGLICELSISSEAEIDTKPQQGACRMVSATFTEFVHLRSWQKIPEIGKVIKIKAKSRFYRLRNSSLAWVRGWECFEGKILAKSKVVLIGS